MQEAGTCGRLRVKPLRYIDANNLTGWLQAFKGTAVSARPLAPLRAQQRQRLAARADAVKTENEYSTEVKVSVV